jgi:hypothetical protein
VLFAEISLSLCLSVSLSLSLAHTHSLYSLDSTHGQYRVYRSEAEIDEQRKVDEKRDRELFKAQAFHDALQWKSFVDDHDGQTIMFLSTITGELRTGLPNALDWVVQDDGFGFPSFYNLVTQHVVFEDPRFTYDVGEDMIQQRKFVMQEMRFCVYVCKDLWDEYNRLVSLHSAEDAAGDHQQHRDVYKMMIKIRNSPKVAQLNSFLIRAQALYQPSSIVDKPTDRAIVEELQYTSWLVTRLAEIVDHTEHYLRTRKDAKGQIVDKLTAQSGKKAVCANCKRELDRHLTYCPFCGKQQI